MSTDTQSDGQGGAGRREVAYRLFATEFDDSTVSHSDSDEERAPNYVITPTGARVNRLFVVGVLTEVESVSEDVLRARVVDPTGAFVIYAGQYQPNPMTFLERAEPPMFVAVTGKARTYQPEDSDRIFTSIRPESINEVDSDTRDRWTVQTTEQTIERIETFIASRDRPETGSDLEEALLADGVDVGLAAGIPLAMAKYGTTDAYLAAVHEIAIDAVRVVANEREEVPPLELAPDEGGSESVELETGSVDVPSETTTTASSPAVESQTDSGSVGAEEGTTAEQPSTATGSDAEAKPEPAAATAETEPSAETATDGSSEPTTPTEEEGGSGTDDLGDFDDFTDTNTGSVGESESTTESAAETETEADLDVASDEMYEFDEEEREEIEEEYGTEFSTGTEVDEPGEADIETPSPTQDEPEEVAGETEPEVAKAEELATSDDETTDVEEAAADATEDETPDDETDATTEPAEVKSEADEDTDSGDAGDEEAETVALDDAVIDVMTELDDGDGADREELIETVSDRHGTDAADVEDAIQDALMSGQCYEPDEGKLKAI